MPATVLSMQGIDKRFAGVAALTGASLEVRAGEVHALIGQNGAGKSTLIKILTGYHSRDAGEIFFDGRPVSFSSPHQAQSAGISTIYQEINLVPYRSVTENICLGRETRRMGFLDWQAMHREAEALLGRFRVHVDVRQPVSAYSTALQQMVAIARAIGFRAKLVIMDEPTSSLDEKEVAVLFEVVRHLQQAGVATIFVSHKLDELYAICDRVTTMRDGRTVRTDPMQAISRLELVTAMLGRQLDTDRARKHSAGHSQSAREPVLRVSGLSAGRKVRNVTLEVCRGEIVGLAGLLGSGRTETARVLFGAAAASAGEILIEGTPAQFTEPAQAIQAGVGYLAEDRKLEGIVPGMSVQENLTLALMPRLARRGIVDEAKSREIVQAFIKRLDIKCVGPDQPVGELSGGNQQKVLLARWLCMNPRLLLLDEPTRGIDVGAKAEILALVRELAAQGLGVLMISSELEELVEAAARLFVLRDGITVAQLEGEQVSETSIIAAMAEADSPAAVEVR